MGILASREVKKKTQGERRGCGTEKKLTEQEMNKGYRPRGTGMEKRVKEGPEA